MFHTSTSWGRGVRRGEAEVPSESQTRFPCEGDSEKAYIMSNLPGRTITRGRSQRPAAREWGVGAAALAQAVAGLGDAGGGRGWRRRGGRGGRRAGSSPRGDRVQQLQGGGPRRPRAPRRVHRLRLGQEVSARSHGGGRSDEDHRPRTPPPPVAATSAAFGSAWAAPAPPQIRCPWPPPPAADAPRRHLTTPLPVAAASRVRSVCRSQIRLGRACPIADLRADWYRI